MTKGTISTSTRQNDSVLAHENPVGNIHRSPRRESSRCAATSSTTTMARMLVELFAPKKMLFCSSHEQ